MNGSKAFEQAQEHRSNYINWSINQLNLNNIRQINIEKIKDLRKGRKSSRRLSHWTYTEVFSKLESTCSEQGVLVNKVDPAYTNCRCSKCGWTCSTNRRRKKFKCVSCGFTQDADLNASINIGTNLTFIKYGSKKQQKLDKAGFYWLTEGAKPIVSSVPETN